MKVLIFCAFFLLAGYVLGSWLGLIIATLILVITGIAIFVDVEEDEEQDER
jgi:hypothetical protein